MSALYSRDILRLAVASADFPPLTLHDARVELRSPLCGSRIVLDVQLAHDAGIGTIGFAIHACAIGQASATLLARHAAGRDAAALSATADAVEHWLADEDAPLPDWPEIATLANVREFPARRGAALLPFQAAAAAAEMASKAAAA